MDIDNKFTPYEQRILRNSKSIYNSRTGSLMLGIGSSFFYISAIFTGVDPEPSAYAYISLIMFALTAFYHAKCKHIESIRKTIDENKITDILRENK